MPFDTFEVEQSFSHGAVLFDSGQTRFRVWAPRAGRMLLHITSPQERVFEMQPCARGYFEVTVEAAQGTRYWYVFENDVERPDPASRFQPDGVHGPSEVVSSNYTWRSANWFGLPLAGYIVYELHTGTFSAAGTFDGVAVQLNRLVELGITAVELMPVAQFPGNRNWGYDGVYPFAVQNSYGGPGALKRLVDACHQHGLCVILDVVYNHLGPEGNYAAEFGPYFTDRYITPWGRAINFDGAGSDEVRRFFIESAVRWIDEFRIDALRLDAVHSMVDCSPVPFLEELSIAVHDAAEKLNRRVYLIAEHADNDARIIRPRELGGYGLDAQWSEDFHHSLHTLLTGESFGYYRDYGSLTHLARAFRNGFAYTGEFSPFRGRRHGRDTQGIRPTQFVVFCQNHDQVGNRMLGDRLAALVGFERLKIAAAAVLLSPFVPLLFMGEEYGEPAPFLYAVSHSDPDLVEAVRQGRSREFSEHGWKGEPPDAQSEETFARCILNPDLRFCGSHKILWDYYRELIQIRKGIRAIRNAAWGSFDVGLREEQQLLVTRSYSDGQRVAIAYHFGDTKAMLSLKEGRWRTILDSTDRRWGGPGNTPPRQAGGGQEKQHVVLAPLSVTVFLYEDEQ